jgi:hypothetical protein
MNVEGTSGLNLTHKIEHLFVVEEGVEFPQAAPNGF